jgi:hypothetical protein
VGQAGGRRGVVSEERERGSTVEVITDIRNKPTDIWWKVLSQGFKYCIGSVVVCIVK